MIQTTLRKLLIWGVGIFVLSLVLPTLSHGSHSADEHAERKVLFEQMSALTGIPWTYLAAVDQYERSLNLAIPKKRPQREREGLIAIRFTDAQWAGALNPDPHEQHPDAIAWFGGIGKDGDGDGIADKENDIDLLYTMATHILQYGTSEDDFRVAMWELYKTANSAKRIAQFAKIYAHFDRLDLFHKVFPLPLGTNYSYRSTWGAARSYGGYRIHEGTDIFAGYGVPVRSTCYGIIEVMGWNRYGGWRVGIRDLNGVYHYYAHLSGFNKQWSEGSIVSPGDTIGWVGSSGYGKPGTQGKFPPHLHYGLYRDAGYTEWSFDPYPYLKKWEREERQARRRR